MQSDNSDFRHPEIQKHDIMKTKKHDIMKLTFASIGSISHGTLRTEDLLEAFSSELDWQFRRSGNFFSLPENHAGGRKINDLLGECQDQYEEDGETLKDESIAEELVQSLSDALEQFAPAYCYFGACEGDGSDFGFWPSMYDIEELPTVEDSDAAKELGDDCKSVNDHGNVTVYSGAGEVVLELV